MSFEEVNVPRLGQAPTDIQILIFSFLSPIEIIAVGQVRSSLIIDLYEYLNFPYNTKISVDMQISLRCL